MERDSIEFAKIWKQQEVSQPDFEDLQHRLSAFKSSSRNKLITTNLLFLATFTVLIVIWNYIDTQLIGSKIGIVLVVGAMALFIGFYNWQSSSSIYKGNTTLNNSEYLKELKKVKEHQKLMHTKIIALYLIVLTLGVAMHMYEYTLKMELFWRITTYILLLGWMGVNWFFLRPLIIRKQQKKLNELIESLEDYCKQLNS